MDRLKRRPRLWWSSLTMVLALGPGAACAGAHDLWIQPSTFHPAPDELVRVDLRIGHPATGGEPVPRDDSHLERFILQGPDGETAIPGLDGREPAGWIRPPVPGRYVLALRSREAVNVLPARAFESYLREEGLDRVIAERARRDETDQPGKERYSRALKALLTVESPRAAPHTPGAPHKAGDTVWNRPLGLRLELMLLDDPQALRPETTLTVELRFEGRPLPGALVQAHSLEAGRDPRALDGRHDPVFRARTDDRGRITFVPPSGGAWLLTAVHMVPAPTEVTEDWQSVWTALTFDVGGN